MNLYGYVLADPINKIDPSGLTSLVPNPLYYPISPGLLPKTGSMNQSPSLLQKMIFLLDKPITPETEGKVLQDFMDNVIDHKDDE